MSWYVLYTKPRNEKKVATLLKKKNITVYCPIQTVTKQWSDRKKKIDEPIFRSYIFVQLQDYQKESIEVLLTDGAVRFLWWLGKPGIVRDEEIEAIQGFLSTYKTVSAHSLNEGQEVTFKDGPFRDKIATIVEVRGNKAILYIESLGWQLTAPISTIMPSE